MSGASGLVPSPQDVPQLAVNRFHRAIPTSSTSSRSQSSNNVILSIIRVDQDVVVSRDLGFGHPRAGS